MRPLVLLLFACSGLLLACSDGAAPGARWAGTVDTLPGGVVRVANPDRPLWSEEERWALVEELRLGTLEGEGAELFAEVRGIAPDAAGRIHVLEGQAVEIRTFGPRGGHLRTFGREGEGPGEMKSPFEMAMSPEQTLWVLDLSNQRFLLFDTSGVHLDDVPRPSFHVREPTFLEDGDLVDLASRRTPDGASTVLVRGRLEGGSLVFRDTFPMPHFEGEPRSVRVRGATGGNTFSLAFPIPFQPSREWAVTRDGLVVSGDGTSAYRILYRTLAGDTVRIVERPYEPVPVPAEERRDRLRTLVERGAEIDPADVPEVYPPFDGLRVAEDGHLWVHRTTAGGEGGWDVFDPEGLFLGAVRVPDTLRAFQPAVVGSDALWGLQPGPFDEPYVLRVGIRKGRGDGAGADRN